MKRWTFVTQFITDDNKTFQYAVLELHCNNQIVEQTIDKSGTLGGRVELQKGIISDYGLKIDYEYEPESVELNQWSDAVIQTLCRKEQND